MHGAAPGPAAAMMDFCGCRERFLPPGRFIQMGRSGNGAFPGAAGLLVSSFLSFPCLTMAGWQPAETAPETGLSQEAEQSRASSDTRRPCIIFLAAGKDRQHGTAHWRGRPLGQFGDKARFESAPFQEDGSPWGHGIERAVRKTG